MLDISLKNNPEMYFDYRENLTFFKSLDDSKYSYPDEVVNFHVYSELRTEKEIECIRSYFATQNLEKTKLILWSDYDVSSQENLQPFKDYIDFRIYDPIEESKGTILEGRANMLLAKDGKHYLQSDLLRLLALHKYGGIWIDMDIILFRDFKPILDQEYMYQWGSETNYAKDGCCATVLSLKKNSEFSNKLLEESLNMPIIPNTTIWGKDLFASLYSKWPNFTIFPSPFFNIEWLISKVDKPLSEVVESYWFENECPDELLFTDCFAWHWHNSSKKGQKLVLNSKFDKLRKITSVKLKERKFI